MFGSDNHKKDNDTSGVDNAAAAAADSYDDSNGHGAMVVSPTTPPPPPPPPPAVPPAAAPATTPSAPPLSLPSVQPTDPVPEDDELETHHDEAAPVPAPESSEPSSAPAVPETAPEVPPEAVPEAVALPPEKAAGTELAHEAVHDKMESVIPSHISGISSPAGGAAPSKVTDQDMEDLFLIKQDALHDLSPLISQLHQAPEERFRTLMMMIQASDDEALIRPAYDAAHEIEDETVRAQALLDIVNEINYFTQQKAQQTGA